MKGLGNEELQRKERKKEMSGEESKGNKGTSGDEMTGKERSQVQTK